MMVEADADQLGQVVLNLLTNAGHAVDGDGSIALTGGRDARGVWLTIEDDGCGIPEENHKRIFEPFFSTRQIGEGTGLGLAISYGIVVQHGGRIEVDSTVGEGTRFTMWLPLAGAA